MKQRDLRVELKQNIFNSPTPKIQKKPGLYSIPTTNGTISYIDSNDTYANRRGDQDIIPLEQFDFDVPRSRGAESDLESNRTLRESNDQARLVYQDPLAHYVARPPPTLYRE